MTEMKKTLAFVFAGLTAITLAIVTRPTPVGVTPNAQIGKALFEEFSDPLAANGLEVVSFDEELGQFKTFKVAQKEKGVWAIPSHQNYPADAENRLEETATMFVDLEVINIVSEAEGEHEVFGVIEPDIEKISLGDEGVGTMVTITGKDKDAHQTKLAALIIGKEVKDVDGQRYARLPGKPRVYQLKIDPSKLSTKFEDWIETDLLDLNTWDIENITLKDYSLEVGLGGNARFDERLAITVYEESGEWKLDQISEFRNGGLVPSALLDGEELDEERLDTLRDSLGDLKIVDVARKPKGLGADLKADKGFLDDNEGLNSLAQRGFYPVTRNNVLELLSSEGELIINTKEGVEYVLRFGQIAGIGEKDADGESGGVNRFLFVTARVNEDHFPMPDLEPLPEGAVAVETALPGSSDADSEDQAEQSADTEQTADTDESETESELADELDTESELADESETESELADDTDKSETDSELADEVARITRENQRKLDDRQDKLDKAEEKVAELTFRFADWYYIISDDVYKKVRLRRNDMISYSEEAVKSGTGLGAFRELEKQGVTPDASDAEAAEDN